MHLRLNMMPLSQLVLLLVFMDFAQADNLHRNNNDDGQIDLELVSDVESAYLTLELGQNGDDEFGAVVSRGKEDSTVTRPNRSNSASLQQWPMSCPKEAASKRSGVSGFANMIFHKPGASKGYKISENSKGDWSKIDIDSMIKRGGFDLAKPTVLYTHGWFQDGLDTWLTDVRKLYNKMTASGSFKPGFNLLTFDWGAYNSVIYGNSVSHVPHVGSLLAQFFEQLRDRHNYNATSIHLVSFSLSTHIVAVAARQLAKKDKINQITALDPTGVCFHENKSKSFDAKYGLKASDARAVVARHYDMDSLGSKRLIGGIDIIVNDGRFQPSMTGGPAYATRDITSHLRATYHETDPFNLKSDCHEIAYSCDSYDAFINGQCGDCGSKNESCYLVSTFGNIQLKTPTSVYKPGTKLYTITGRGQFCVYLYQVVVQLRRGVTSSTISEFSKGRFTFGLGADRPTVNPKHRVTISNRFTQLLQPKSKIESFQERIQLGSRSADLLSSVEYIEIKFLSHVSATVRRASSTKYCANKSTNKELIRCKQDAKKRRSSMSKSKA